MMPEGLLDQLRIAIGAQHVWTEQADKAPYLTDWRKRYAGRALAVIQPGNTAEVAACVRLCAASRTPVVPQGGNTGLVGGATPDDSGHAVVLRLARMNRIRELDPVNNTITAEAGVLLAALQQSASESGRLFPLSLASEGSCTLGGNLSTNAGGTGVLRYGNTRELCLALEAVTPNGDVIGSRNGLLHGLRKDNTGYDLRDLFIGAEGTLGIVTAAVMKLYPQPLARVTAFAAVRTPDHALALLNLAQEQVGASLTAFELVSDLALSLVEKHFPDHRSPFTARHPYCVLLELSDAESEAHADARFAHLMESALEQALIVDAVVAQSIAQSRGLWALREHISEAQAAEGKNIKHDISLPISRIADFIASTDAALQQAFPGVRMVNFGHLGDGNLHYNVSPPVGQSDTAFLMHQDAVNRLVHDAVDAAHGSISAEHGLGQLKREEIRRYKSPADLTLMRTLKTAIDPLNIMNPGKIL